MDQTFDAHVINGQLVAGDSLRQFEGRQVQVTVSLPDNLAEPGIDTVDDREAEELDVEKDVYVPMPLPSTMISHPILASASLLKPCLILPEELGPEKACDE